MENDIYRQHEAAFKNVSAFVVLNGANERVASIAFKFPQDGAGRLYCYLHIFGTRMVRGFASGGGYDKKSAAVASASGKVSTAGLLPDYKKDHDTIEAIQKAVGKDSGYSWDRELENAGFKVFQAV
jgi:hypothetical protein